MHLAPVPVVVLLEPGTRSDQKLKRKRLKNVRCFTGNLINNPSRRRVTPAPFFDQRRSVAKRPKGLNNWTALPFLDSLKKTTRRTRCMHSEHFVTPLAKKNLYKFSFLPRTVLCWNNLPQTVINVSTNPEAFSSSLTSHYLTWNCQRQTTSVQVTSHEVAQ